MAIPGTGVTRRRKFCGAEKSSGEGGWTFPMEVKTDVRWSSEEGWGITMQQGPMYVFLGVPAGEIVQMRARSGRVK